MEATSSILTDLFILFVAAKLAGAAFSWLRQPPVIGELLAGVIIGPYAFGWVGVADPALIALFHGDQVAAQEAVDLVLEMLAELGVILLLFFVGLETRLADLISVGRRAAVVGTLGIALPFAGGFLIVKALGEETIPALFVAVALVATSTGVTARVLRDLGVLDAPESRIILGAAVIDDILAMILLAFVTGLSDAGEFEVLNLSLIGLQAVGFVVFGVLVGTRVLRRYHSSLDRLPLTNAPLMLGLAMMLGLAAVATSVGLAAIIGAFLAGMILAEAAEHYDLERAILPIFEFLVPFFFVVTGTRVDPTLFLDWDTMALALLITGVAILTKLVGAGVGGYGMGIRPMAVIGSGMVPRGEVGLIVASLGLSRGVIGTDFFSIVAVMSILTTLVVPPVLSLLLRAAPHRPAPTGDARMASSGRLPTM